MIKTLTLTDVYNTLNAISDITDVVELYSMKPSWKEIEKISDKTYCWISIISNNKNVSTNTWFITARARISLKIVAPEQTSVLGTENSSDLIDNVIDVINNAIVDEWCTKIASFGNVWCMWVVEWEATPILYTPNDRASKSKDYFISYVSKNG